MLGFILGSLECVYVLEDAFAFRVILLNLVLEREDVDVVLDHLQSIYGGLHNIDVLTLQNKI